jgi:hypothetical protein
VLLAAFVAWEYALGRRQQSWHSAGRGLTGAPARALAGGRAREGAPPGHRAQPLIDLTLFRSAGFTWGAILSTMVSFALFGIIFAMPQYFLDVRGLDSLGAGIRLLPLIGGLALGLGIGQRLLTPRKSADGGPAGPAPVNAKIVAAGGFTIMAAALAIGAGTTAASGTGFAAAWFALAGLGLGFAMPTALNAALGALSAERSGSGSAVITAMRQVGGTIGVAVLGTILASAYRAHLSVAALSAPAAAAVRSSVAGGLAVARTAGSAALLEMVRAAYVHGMDVMLWVCAGIAVAAALLAVAFLPGRADGGPAATEPAAAEPSQPAATERAATEPAGGGSGPAAAVRAQWRA